MDKGGRMVTGQELMSDTDHHKTCHSYTDPFPFCLIHVPNDTFLV